MFGGDACEKDFLANFPLLKVGPSLCLFLLLCMCCC